MTSKDRIMAFWRMGKDTYEIARAMSATSTRDWTEAEVHQIIITERADRLAKTTLRTIEGGAANGR